MPGVVTGVTGANVITGSTGVVGVVVSPPLDPSVDDELLPVEEFDTPVDDPPAFAVDPPVELDDPDDELVEVELPEELVEVVEPEPPEDFDPDPVDAPLVPPVDLPYR